MKYKFVFLKNLYFLKMMMMVLCNIIFEENVLSLTKILKKIMYFSSLELDDGTKCV